MDCQQIMELLDGYALGASDEKETRHIESHVADCVRCWEELSKAQQTAALLALSVPIHQAPARIGERIMSQVQREKAGIRNVEDKAPFWQRFRLGWPVASGAFAATSAAAVIFAAFLQVQVSDLKDENSALESNLRSATFSMEQQLAAADTRLTEQQTIFTVLADSNKEEVKVGPSSATVQATAYYTWSPDTKKGFVRCENLPSLPPGKVYQLWVTSERKAHPVATVQPDNGWCQVPLDMDFLTGDMAGIGISVEQLPGGIERPKGGWLLYAHFPD